MNEKTIVLINFFNKCGLNCKSLKDLSEKQIPRDILLDLKLYNNLYDSICELKEIYSTTKTTSLQSSAESKQKWPLLNLVRQILKLNGYKLIPLRLSDGYTKDGKKKYKRFFLIKEKL
mgnify:CR=1 FL=1